MRSQLPLFLSRLSWSNLALASTEEIPTNKHKITYPRAIEKMAPITRLPGFDFCRAFVSCFDGRRGAGTCDDNTAHYAAQCTMIYGSQATSMAISALACCCRTRMDGHAAVFSPIVTSL
jgi:hypothetical protein